MPATETSLLLLSLLGGHRLRVRNLFGAWNPHSLKNEGVSRGCTSRLSQRVMQEREEQIPHNSAYTWNLEKWYNDLICKAETDTDAHNKCADAEGIKEG